MPTRDSQRGDGSVRSGEEELADHEPVQPVHLDLHPGDFLNAAHGFARQETEDELLHPRREVVEPPQEAVDRKASRFDEVLDRHEPRALVYDREAC